MATATGLQGQKSSPEQMRVRLRPDLVVNRQYYEGQTHYVIKDPVALRYFRFREEEYYLLRLLDGHRTLAEIKDDFERRFQPQTVTIEDLQHFVSQLHQSAIATIDTPLQGKVLYDRYKKRKIEKIKQFLANILYVKIPVTDPERQLVHLHKFFFWIYTRTFVILTLALMVSAVTWVTVQHKEFFARLPEFHAFFNWHNVIFFWITLAVVKVIHEYGHGLTCKHFGGEVHEMGILFLVLTPALYCDVSDAWLLPNKWHRIWISAAGIYVELCVAALATFVWWNTDRGSLLNNLSLAAMFICSVNTVMFNANPLLRYDGYYVLADLLEVPNLRIKSTQLFQSLFMEYCLGMENPGLNFLPRTRRTLFVTYAIASYIYRWVVTFAILMFLYRFLRPYKLAVLSDMLALGSIVALVVVPLYQLGKLIFTPGRITKVKKTHMVASAILFGAIGFLIFGVPYPFRVKTNLVLKAQDAADVYVDVPGRLTELLVKDNQPVQKGQVLARLENPDKLREKLELETERQRYWLEVRTYEAASFKTTDRRAQLDAAIKGFKDKTAELEQKDKEIARLEIRAPRDGRVLAPPKPEELGATLKTGSVFCTVGDPAYLEAHMLVDQSDIDVVKPKQQTRIKLYDAPEQTLSGTVERIAFTDSKHIPPELSSQAGGTVQAKQDPHNNAQADPLHPVYEAVVLVPNPRGDLQVGLRGWGKVYCGNATLLWRLWRAFTHTFNFTL